MTNITILDTGYVRTDNSGSQLATSARANSGSVISLQSVSVNFDTKSNLDDSPALGTYTECEVNLASFENRKIVIQGVFKTSSATDMALVYPLHQLVQTKGYKAIYYPSVGDTTQLISKMSNGVTFSAAERAANYFVSGLTLGAYYKLTVRFRSFMTQQTADSKLIYWTLEGVITA